MIPTPLRRGHRKLRTTRISIRSPEENTVTGPEAPERMLLWIDAVGGYLVCLDDHLVLGQPTPGQPIALPIMADISRRHAVLHRDNGSYVLEPVHETFIDGRKITGPTVVRDGQLIGLGESVRIRFRRPHALSSTATLGVETGHKTQPSSDGVILMADSCLIGAGSHSHITARHWDTDVIIYRHEGSLLCRSTQEIKVKNEVVTGPIKILPGERVEGDDFSLCIEKT